MLFEDFVEPCKTQRKTWELYIWPIRKTSKYATCPTTELVFIPPHESLKARFYTLYTKCTNAPCDVLSHTMLCSTVWGGCHVAPPTNQSREALAEEVWLKVIDFAWLSAMPRLPLEPAQGVGSEAMWTCSLLPCGVWVTCTSRSTSISTLALPMLWGNDFHLQWLVKRGQAFPQFALIFTTSKISQCNVVPIGWICFDLQILGRTEWKHIKKIW